MGDKYIIKDRVAYPVELLEWAAWYGSHVRVVSQTNIVTYYVSTVSLGLDHSYGDGPPLIFETLVRNVDRNAEIMWRYTSWKQARSWHRFIVRHLEAGRNLDDLDVFWDTGEWPG